MSDLIVVCGSLAQKPGYGGHTWVILQYLLGLRRLGWEVLFVDRLDGESCRDKRGRPCSLERSVNAAYEVRVMQQFDMAEAFILLTDQSENDIGVSRAKLEESLRRSTFLINIMGFLDDPYLRGLARRPVYVDIDPGFGQMWHELGLADLYQGHDAFVTIGQNLGQPKCEVPDCGLTWITTPQPIVLEHWPVSEQTQSPWWTTVGSWRGAYGPVEYRGKTYGLRVHEFRKFMEVPRLTGQPFEFAADIHPADTRDLTSLEAGGWRLADPHRVAGDPWAYRAYVQSSKAEFSVAKNMYVQARAGWVSDRSICYLASGKPVVTEDTGITGIYPTGEGLITYRTNDEALHAVDDVGANYNRHRRAARELAETFFDSDMVLRRLLDRVNS